MCPGQLGPVAQLSGAKFRIKTYKKSILEFFQLCRARWWGGAVVVGRGGHRWAAVELSIPGCGFMQRWPSTPDQAGSHARTQRVAFHCHRLGVPQRCPGPEGVVSVVFSPFFGRRGTFWAGFEELRPRDHVSVVGGQQVGKQEPEPWAGTSEEDLGPGLLCHPQLHHHWEVKDEEVELQEVWGAEGEPAWQAHVRPKSPFRENQQVGGRVLNMKVWKSPQYESVKESSIWKCETVLSMNMKGWKRLSVSVNILIFGTRNGSWKSVTGWMRKDKKGSWGKKQTRFRCVTQTMCWSRRMFYSIKW